MDKSSSISLSFSLQAFYKHEVCENLHLCTIQSNLGSHQGGTWIRENHSTVKDRQWQHTPQILRVSIARLKCFAVGTKMKYLNIIGYQLPNLGTNSTGHMSFLWEHLYVLLHRLPGCKKNMLKCLLMYLWRCGLRASLQIGCSASVSQNSQASSDTFSSLSCVLISMYYKNVHIKSISPHITSVSCQLRYNIYSLRTSNLLLE